MKTTASLEFSALLVEEYSAIATKTNLGQHLNRMVLTVQEDGSGSIVWNYGKQAADEDETVIGLTFDGHKLTDYDGVFSLPKQAELLIQSAGFSLGDCSSTIAVPCETVEQFRDALNTAQHIIVTEGASGTGCGDMKYQRERGNIAAALNKARGLSL